MYSAYHPYSMPPAPNSPSQSSDATEEPPAFPDPPPISRISGGKAYVLEVQQQPIRARMCGFGEKDRRPISPPPCVRLMIIDIKTGLEVDYNQYNDHLSKFVLHVDLVTPANQGNNLIRHSVSSPSISSVVPTSYPQSMTNIASAPLQSYNVSNVPAYAGQTFPSPVQATPTTTHSYDQSSVQPQHFYQNGNHNYNRPLTYPTYNDPRYAPYTNGYHPNPGPLPPMQGPDLSRTDTCEDRGSCSRTLIGSTSASVFKLHDEHKKSGLWFVLQDLSIRNEGWFRLKLSFFDLGNYGSRDGTSELAEIAPMLACAYSRTFRVFSAKKFPGVIESTTLSKVFALQGIKIPIRKDTGAKRRRGDSEQEENGGED